MGEMEKILDLCNKNNEDTTPLQSDKQLSSKELNTSTSSRSDVENNQESSNLPNTDNLLDIRVMKTSLLGKEQAKKRLQAFCPTKKLEVIRPKVLGVSEEEKSDEKHRHRKKNSKKGADPNEKAKTVIEEIEEIKKIESAFGALEQQLVLNKHQGRRKRSLSRSRDRDRSTKRSKKERKRSRSKDNSNKSKSCKVEQRKYPSSWNELNENNLDVEELPTLFPTQFNIDTNKIYDFRQQLLFQAPSHPLQPFLAEGVNEKPFLYPAGSIRMTTCYPLLPYCESVEVPSEMLTRKCVLEYVPRRYRRTLEQFMNNTKLQCKPKSIITTTSRKWYPKESTAHTLQENSLGLTFLQNYSDDDDEQDKEEMCNDNDIDSDDVIAEILEDIGKTELLLTKNTHNENTSQDTAAKNESQSHTDTNGTPKKKSKKKRKKKDKKHSETKKKKSKRHKNDKVKKDKKKSDEKQEKIKTNKKEKTVKKEESKEHRKDSKSKVDEVVDKRTKEHKKRHTKTDASNSKTDMVTEEKSKKRNSSKNKSKAKKAKHSLKKSLNAEDNTTTVKNKKKKKRKRSKTEDDILEISDDEDGRTSAELRKIIEEKQKILEEHTRREEEDISKTNVKITIKSDDDDHINILKSKHSTPKKSARKVYREHQIQEDVKTFAKDEMVSNHKKTENRTDNRQIIDEKLSKKEEFVASVSKLHDKPKNSNRSDSRILEEETSKKEEFVASVSDDKLKESNLQIEEDGIYTLNELENIETNEENTVKKETVQQNSSTEIENSHKNTTEDGIKEKEQLENKDTTTEYYSFDDDELGGTPEIGTPQNGTPQNGTPQNKNVQQYEHNMQNQLYSPDKRLEEPEATTLNLSFTKSDETEVRTTEKEIKTPDTNEYFSEWESDEDVIKPDVHNRSWESEDDMLHNKSKSFNDRNSSPFPDRSRYTNFSLDTPLLPKDEPYKRPVEERRRRSLEHSPDKFLEMPFNINNVKRDRHNWRDDRSGTRSYYNRSPDHIEPDFRRQDEKPYLLSEDSWEKSDMLSIKTEELRLEQERLSILKERRQLELDKQKFQEQEKQRQQARALQVQEQNKRQNDSYYDQFNLNNSLENPSHSTGRQRRRWDVHDKTSSSSRDMVRSPPSQNRHRSEVVDKKQKRDDQKEKRPDNSHRPTGNRPQKSEKPEKLENEYEKFMELLDTDEKKDVQKISKPNDSKVKDRKHSKTKSKTQTKKISSTSSSSSSSTSSDSDSSSSSSSSSTSTSSSSSYRKYKKSKKLPLVNAITSPTSVLKTKAIQVVKNEIAKPDAPLPVPSPNPSASKTKTNHEVIASSVTQTSEIDAVISRNKPAVVSRQNSSKHSHDDNPSIKVPFTERRDGMRVFRSSSRSPSFRRDSSPREKWTQMGSPKRTRRRSLSPAQSDMYRKRDYLSRRNDYSPWRETSPRRRDFSPRRYRTDRSLSREHKESIQEMLQRLAGIDQFTRRKSPVRSPVHGFKRSVADSTISDEQLLQYRVEEHLETPQYMTRSAYAPPSPKRMLSDKRGVPVAQQKTISTSYTDNYQYAQECQYYEQYNQYNDANTRTNSRDNHYRRRTINQVVLQPVPFEDYRLKVKQQKEQVQQNAKIGQLPPLQQNEVTNTTQQIKQVGNILEIIPTQSIEKPEIPRPTSVKTSISTLNSATPTTSIIMTATVTSTTTTKIPSSPVVTTSASVIVASAAIKPSSPLIEDVSPVSLIELSPTSSTTPLSSSPKDMNAEALIKLKLERRSKKGKRRLERELKHGEKAKKNNIQGDSDVEQDSVISIDDESPSIEGVDSISIDIFQWPVPKIIFDSSHVPPEKGILVGGSRHSKSLEEINTTDEVRKFVKFADGVVPGEGTSPSGGEELSSPPPAPTKLPKEKRYKKTKIPKAAKMPKKKVKVKVIRRAEDDDEEDDLPPPPPPPGSPPSHIFPARLKTIINNIHPVAASIATSILQPASPLSHPPTFRPGVSVITHQRSTLPQGGALQQHHLGAFSSSPIVTPAGTGLPQVPLTIPPSILTPHHSHHVGHSNNHRQSPYTGHHHL